ncbi:NAD(P)-binding domain-containing protein [Enterococcus columbae]|uniref:6-phosphogluconate dehydrogenase NADP-binding domain-containing protein n=1 Tax=Enterococcus columbae DSM 7374 = ATCC 51263 TaxID=1121865 RepID=S0KU61_9ENTE|nr:NAD(P)-binding domain-containing protein [Enterococcus columbae]EOT44530.1 hypothetical protein OMW_00586 [Enterococcus columbae DSM 7374 = ATCC 51263]EOW84688.1 hypothetical protein I568_01184 [Enterococcus columbae DSM 7374 = ATCC 51263]OJG21086.1 hypothetical protein RR47_GL001469 [Enterococcus columbae DSM 7374 = ATCC 51263]
MAQQNFIIDKNISFIGVGSMGIGVAKNLCEKLEFSQFKLFEHRHKIDIELLKCFKNNIQIVRDLKDIAYDADIIFICLPNSSISKQILFNDYFTSNIKEGAAIVDLTTQSIDFTAQAIEIFQKLGINYHDCPLIRSPKDSMEGKLVTLAGGIFKGDCLYNIIEIFSEKIFCLPLGKATQYKLLNNYICMAFNAIIQTGVFYSEELNLDRHLFEKIMLTGTNYIVALSLINQYIDNKDNKVLNFKIRDALKDLNYFYDMVQDKVPSSNIYIIDTICQIFSKANVSNEVTLPMLYEVLKNEKIYN